MLRTILLDALYVIAFSVFPIFAWVFAVWLPPRNRSDDEDDLRPATT